MARRELRIIRDDLHCTAVRVTGGDRDRLELAAAAAAEAGLEVWFSPFTCDLSTDELAELLGDCAGRAERVRRRSELSLFTIGFLPSETIADRLELCRRPDRLRAALPEVPARVNEFLGPAVRLVRERFGGTVTYASRWIASTRSTAAFRSAAASSLPTSRSR